MASRARRLWVVRPDEPGRQDNRADLYLIPLSGCWFMMGFLSRAISLVSGHARLLRVTEAFGVEVGQVAAFGARRRVDDAVDEHRRTVGQRVGQGGGQFGRCGGPITGAAE